MGTHTIEVTGISDELLRALDERIRERGGDRADFIRDLMRRELQGGPDSALESRHPHAGMSFEEILTPVHQQTERSGITDEELTQLFEETREQVRKSKKAARTPG